MSFLKRLFLFLFLLVCITGCQKSNKAQASHLRLALSNEPPQLDPRKAKDSTSGTILLMCSEGLLRHNFQGTIAPGLAESYEVDASQTRYTFTLRPDLTWSDGSALTAYDFEYAWRKVLEPHFVSEYAYIFFCIKNAQPVKEGKLSSDQLGIRVIDERHLEVELEHPVSYFDELVAFYTFYPVSRAIDEKNNHWSQDAGDLFLSCGPFQLVTWKHNSEMTLKKNPRYWDADNVHLESIHISILQDESTMLNLFENNDIDFIGAIVLGAIPLDAIPQWRASGHLHSRPVANSLWYKINTTLPVLRNQKIRQALSLAIDRKSIAENITQGVMRPSTSFLPSSMALNSSLIPEEAMREKAQRLFIEGLHEENMEWSELPRFRLSCNNNELALRIAQAIQQQWKDHLGLEVSIEKLEWKVYISKIHKMDYEIARMGWAADFHDPMNYLEAYKYSDALRGGNNETGWSDPRYIHLLDEAINSTSKTDYNQYLCEAERIIVEACPVLSLFQNSVNWLQQPRLHNVSVNNLGRVDFKWARTDGEKE